MIKQLKFQRFLAMIYIGTVIGMVTFWWQFFNGMLFLTSELEALMPNFDAYYVWVRSFAVADMFLVIAMMISSIALWTNRWMSKGRVLASACAGIALFRGSLELTYGFSSGLFASDHHFAGVVLELGLSITAVGLIALFILLFAPRCEA